MEQRKPQYVTTEQPQKAPILILDKKGVIGIALAEKLRQHFLVVLVTAAQPQPLPDVIVVPFRTKIPTIPDQRYVSFLTIYNGEAEMMDILSSVVKKADQVQAKMFFITTLAYSTPQVFHHLSLHALHRIKIILYGETFHNYTNEVNLLNFFIHQARVYGRIEIPNAGLGKVYPVAFDDVIMGIISVAFSTEVRHRITFLFSRSPFSEFTVARIMQRIDPVLRLDFRKQTTQQNNFYIPEGGEYFFHSYDLEEKMKRIDFSQRPTATPPPPQKNLALPKKAGKQPGVWTYLFAVFFIILLPVLAVLGSWGIGTVSLQQSLGEAEKGKFPSAKNYAQIANAALQTAQIASEGMIAVEVVAPQQKHAFDEMLQTESRLVDTELDLLDAGIILQKISKGESANPKNDFLHATAILKNTFLTLQEMRAENVLPPQISKKLDALDSTFQFFETTIDTWPTILGFDGQKRYLFLFQNNKELRPGGGFIGSYGLLTVENGRIEDFKVYDVYDADGKLKTPVTPPYGLQRYLGASHWFLRDSNFDIDFPQNAANASRFLQLETGEKVDGVIAIDTDFIKNLLSALGSVTVPDYNETVTADNFYMLTQTHAEKNFFPGSTQKKDFLRALVNAILNEIAERKNVPYIALIKTIGSSLEGKHLLFSFNDGAVQKVFTVNNFSSSLWDQRKAQSNTFLDFFGVIDANVGTNKANYYVKRLLQQNTTITNAGDLEATATVTYQNTSKQTSPYGGVYKNYVRVVLPGNAELKSVSIDDQPVQTTAAITDPEQFTQKSFQPPKELELDTSQEQGKTVIGFLVLVPVESTKKISLTYAIPHVISPDSQEFAYDLRLFKQPGSSDDPYSLFVSYPASFALVKTDGGDGVDVGGKIAFEGILSGDKMITATFSKK